MSEIKSILFQFRKLLIKTGKRYSILISPRTLRFQSNKIASNEIFENLSTEKSSVAKTWFLYQTESMKNLQNGSNVSRK